MCGKIRVMKMNNENKIDCVTVFTAACFSLLSGAVVCTAPTELEEIKKRYDDMLKMLDPKTELVVAEYSVVPEYAEGKWPWATDYNDFASYIRNNITPGVPEDDLPGLGEITWAELQSNERIEEKYRLSRVKSKVITQLRLPF